MFGHPKGLFVLFFTELWERFTFYGMKALLVLYMLNHFLYTQQDASLVMAWYAGLIFCTPLLGGMVADRWLGARRAVFFGGCIMAAGSFLLTVDSKQFFYAGLGFLILGCGLLKPNISTQVGSLYRKADPRRDSAFTIFYMGINIGAFLSPIVCGYLAERIGFRYGFGAAGVGMIIGLIVYMLGQRAIVEVDIAKARTQAGEESAGGGASAGPPVLPHIQRDRVTVLLVVFAFVILFWMCFEQAANVMTVWADTHTNRHIFQAQPDQATVQGEEPATSARRTWRDFEPTASQFQAVNPFFVITLCLFFSWFWLWLDKRGKQPSTPAKMAMGVFFMSLAYGAILCAARSENRPSSASLAAFPGGVHLEKYGATRLSYDPQARELRLHGVLPELDRLRLLSESSDPDLAKAVDELAQKAEERKNGATQDEKWDVTMTVPPGSASALQPTALPPSVHWDSVAAALKTTAVLSERDRLEVMAAGAPAEFREAVNSIFRQSSLFRVSTFWLILHYLLATLGELCLSPVGLSLVTKLAPPRHVGLFMGLWFFTSGGVANFTAHFMGGWWGTMTPARYFSIFLVISLAATVLMALAMGALKRRMHGIN